MSDTPILEPSPEVVDQVLRQMEERGFSMMLHPQRPYGFTGPLSLSAREAKSFLEDPMGFAAKVHGVTRDQMEAWGKADDHEVMFSAITASGRRCRNPVQGSSACSSPSEWVAAQGGYCRVHGG